MALLLSWDKVHTRSYASGARLRSRSRTCATIWAQSHWLSNQTTYAAGGSHPGFVRLASEGTRAVQTTCVRDHLLLRRPPSGNLDSAHRQAGAGPRQYPPFFVPANLRGKAALQLTGAGGLLYLRTRTRLYRSPCAIEHPGCYGRCACTFAVGLCSLCGTEIWQGFHISTVFAWTSTTPGELPGTCLGLEQT
jgi:hypothetical protein